MSVRPGDQRSISRKSTSINVIKCLTIANESSDHVWPNAKRPSSFQPTESLRFSFAACSCSALQVNPEHTPVNYLEIYMPPAYIDVIQNNIST